MIRIGTSGWQYPDWRGAFYPDGLTRSGWLAHYATRFPTVELNNSFYRLPEASTFRRWRDETPEGFVMVVKVSRYLTHVRRLREPDEPLARLWERARPLGSRLGPLLFQLPPRFPVELQRLRGLLDAMPRDASAAFEFRDPSWHTRAVYDVLERANAALVWPDRPGPICELPLTADWGYVRLHQGGPARPGYGPARLRAWADRIAASEASGFWVYFNNDAEAAAPRDALRLTELLRERAPDRLADALPSGRPTRSA